MNAISLKLSIIELEVDESLRLFAIENPSIHHITRTNYYLVVTVVSDTRGIGSREERSRLKLLIDEANDSLLDARLGDRGNILLSSLADAGYYGVALSDYCVAFNRHYARIIAKQRLLYHLIDKRLIRFRF